MALVNAKELKWRWVYVEEPSMEPDEHGRWLVKGYIEVEQGIIPGYDWVGSMRKDIGTVPLVLVHIKRGNELVRDHEGYAFEVIMPHIMDLDNGLAYMYPAATFEEAQAKAQEVLHTLANCLYAPVLVSTCEPVIE